MPENYLFIDFLREKKKSLPRTIWLEPAIQLLLSNQKLLEEVIGEAEKGIFSQ